VTRDDHGGDDDDDGGGGGCHDDHDHIHDGYDEHNDLDDVDHNLYHQVDVLGLQEVRYDGGFGRAGYRAQVQQLRDRLGRDYRHMIMMIMTMTMTMMIIHRDDDDVNQVDVLGLQEVRYDGGFGPAGYRAQVQQLRDRLGREYRHFVYQPAMVR
jgi:endonuclease/exonuclease/phosphatase family metal-dependent hydrolase